MRFLPVWLFVGGTFVGGAAPAQEITLESAPPVVVRTVPEAGSRDVDPKTTEIRVTFSKAMRDKNWSWVILSPESYPTTTGDPRYADDGRTCVLPVKLEPGRTYAIGINSERHHNFKDAAGCPAMPYVLVFKTRD
jgi:hypothetical protein